MPILTLLCAALIGALFWTFAEYWLHRLLGHIPGGKLLFTREHMAHHGVAGYFGPWWMKGLAAIATTAGLYLLCHWILAKEIALAFSVGFSVSYLSYEFFHRRIHTHPPRTALGALLRKHHLQHHFQSARANLGVSNRVWDRVFGTHISTERLSVPRRMAPPWLLDGDNGDVKAAYQQDYKVVGRKA